MTDPDTFDFVPPQPNKDVAFYVLLVLFIAVVAVTLMFS